MPEQKTAWLEMRLKPQVKKEAEQLFKSCGMTMSSAINLFLQQCINAGELPFDISGNIQNDTEED